MDLPPPTRLVGRTADRRRLRDLLDAGAALVTVGGAPGIGKSRLVRDLGIPVVDRPELPEGGVVAVDDAEGFLDDLRPLVVARIANGGQVVVGSRRVLGLDGERVLVLGPLSADDAAELLRDRLPDASDEALSRLADLDGNPLAIELFAARARVLGPGAVGTADLAGGRRFGRWTSLAEAVRASWDPLDPDEQRLLARLSVFRGPFDRAAAESVGGRADRVLDALVDRSLVRVDGSAALRTLAIPAAVRELAFAAASPDERAEVERLHERHLLGSAVPERRLYHLHAPHTAVADLQSVFARAVARSDADLALRAALAIAPAWLATGPYADLAAMATTALDLGGPPELRARVGALLARAHGRCGRVDRAATAAAVAVATAREVGDRWLVGWCLAELAEHAAADRRLDDAITAIDEARATADPPLLAYLELVHGLALTNHGQTDAAHPHLAAASRLHEALGDELLTAYSGGVLARNLYDLGRMSEAEAVATRSAAALDRWDQRRIAAWTRLLTVVLLERRGELAAAEEQGRAVVAVARAIGDLRCEARAGSLLGQVALRAGRRSEARALAADALVLARRTGDPQNQATALSVLLAAADDAGEAVVLGDELERLVDADLRPLVPLHRALHRLRTADPAGLPEAIDGAAAALDAVAAVRTEPVTSLGRLLSDAIAAARSRGSRVRIARDATWFEADGGARVDLRRRDALRRVLRALADADGEALTVDGLFERAWPGDRAGVESARNRVYVALTRLRKLGLRSHLVTRGDGVALDRAGLDWG